MENTATHTSCNQTLDRLPYNVLSTIFLLSENEQVAFVSRSMYEASKNIKMISAYTLSKYGNERTVAAINESDNTFYKHFLRNKDILINLITKSAKNNYSLLFRLGAEYQMENLLVMLLEMHKVTDLSTYSVRCDGAFKFGDISIEFDDDPGWFYGYYTNEYKTYSARVFMLVERFFPYIRPFGRYYGHPSKKFVPTYDTCLYMYKLLIKLKDKLLQVTLPDGQVIERPYRELKFYINLLLTFVHFSHKLGGIDVAKMFIEEGLAVTNDLASLLNYTFTCAQPAIYLFSPAVVNPFMEKLPEKPTDDNGKSNEKSNEKSDRKNDGESDGESDTSSIATINPITAGNVLAPSFLSKDLKVLLLILGVQLNNQKMIKFLLERGLENYQAAFLALRAIGEKEKALLIRVLEMSKIDINLINEKIIYLCRHTILSKSKKAIDVTKTLINTYGLDMSKFGYLILQAAVLTKNFELVNYLTGKKSKYDGAEEKKLKAGLRYNQRYKAAPIDLRTLERNGLSEASQNLKYNAEMIKHLINCGAKPTTNNYEVLLSVIRKEDYSTLEFLLKNGINLQKCPPKLNGIKTASLYCNDRLKMLKFLVENGADPTVCNNVALKYACRSNSYELVKYLLTKGVSPKLSVANGLKELCNGKHWDGKIFRALVEGGANPETHKGLAMKRMRDENDTVSIEFIEKRMAKKAKEAKTAKTTKTTKSTKGVKNTKVAKASKRTKTTRVSKKSK
ncbi:putative ankyrin repeat protein [Zancudomyces culisetae]|uniref:Putative ankyrin repeat protein n=1 Tax=Zancudomyces culisetae TaxID=1213189 RepID=A0A1R1PXW3_ZANCU|nr:putative ankyrin repeat protein [Zancudomyces culisetae]|eukprot:OMH85815.1 putative ankyrin repeat protein [Zancudomyces culisetae]